MQSTRNERLLSIALDLAVHLAILIFVYGFIAWSGRVSLSAWKGLLPDYTWAGFNNIWLFSDPRFHIDIRNTLIFTVTFMLGSCLLGLALGHPARSGTQGREHFSGPFYLSRWRSLLS